MKTYKTVLKEGYFLLEEKKSRFISRAKPVFTEQEAIDYIQSIKSACWDATHNCYAYSIKTDSVYQRYSDDGEPQGTAGLPMLEVIKKKKLFNVVVVVTRYFGGTMLGAGGLVRAYSKACVGGIEDAREILVKSCHKLKIPIEYHLSGKLQNMLINKGYMISETEYSHQVTFTFFSPQDKRLRLENHIKEITGGVLNLEDEGFEDIYIDRSGNIIEVKNNVKNK